MEEQSHSRKFSGHQEVRQTPEGDQDHTRPRSEQGFSPDETRRVEEAEERAGVGAQPKGDAYAEAYEAGARVEKPKDK